MVNTAIWIHFQVLLTLENAVANFAEALVIDEQVRLLQLVRVFFFVEHLNIRHMRTNPLILLYRQQMVEHVLKILQKVVFFANDFPVVWD